MKFEGTESYYLNTELEAIVNMAIKMEKPLLLTGEPGTGKTQLAFEISRSLGLPIEILRAKSTIKGEEACYVQDTVLRLNDARFGTEQTNRNVNEFFDYIIWGPIGRAFLSEERVVLLLDEIDKTESDVQDNLLDVLESTEFTIREVNKTISAKHKPIIIITSNAKRELSDPFLRRCFCHHIAFPHREEMVEIVKLHFPEIKEELLQTSLNIFYELRERGYEKAPATSELLNWIEALQINGINPEKENVPFIGTMLKRTADILSYRSGEKKKKKIYVIMFFIDFVYLLRNYGIPISFQYVMDFYDGLEKSLVETLDDLFLFSRLVFVKRVEHLDAFQRAFALYFFNIDIPKIAEGDYELFNTKQFHEWLKKAVKNGDIPKTFWHMDRNELMKKFWDTVKEQMEAHHGGNKWVGTGGTSPYGNSGFSQRGIRVHGQGQNRSAFKIIGERQYVEYAENNTLSAENIRQALSSLKQLKPTGAYSELNIDETISKTAKNGGEIELVFDREKLDKIKVVLLIDNGGTSMLPFVDLTRTLFSKMKDRFKDMNTYFFHNTIYSYIYKDSRRYDHFSIHKLLEMSPDTRIIFVGDASMAPEELAYSYGSIYMGEEEPESSLYWLNKIRERFKHAIWLNPICKEDWEHTYGSWTLNKIRKIFHMEDLTLRGIKNTVEFLNNKN